MPKFFVPSDWDKSAAAIRFKKIQTNLKGENDAVHTKKNENKVKNLQDSSTSVTKNISTEMDVEVETHLPKAKHGLHGIQKRIQAKRDKKAQKKKLKNTFSKAKTDLIKEQVSQSVPPSLPLHEKLKQELLGGRFRYLNEQLYTMNSKKAEKLFKQDKDAFSAYHEGYRHQVLKWPMNPLDRIIKMVKRLPKSLEIGDFGCGEGRLAKEVPHKVYSMDLISSSPNIIACDMAATPLNNGAIDVAVYCLSLMGTNLKDYILEANRVLKLHGYVYIAEIQSRFENVRDFVRLLESCGFEMTKKDVARNFFYFFQFKKMRSVGKVANIADYSLKPCLYRKR